MCGRDLKMLAARVLHLCRNLRKQMRRKSPLFKISLSKLLEQKVKDKNFSDSEAHDIARRLVAQNLYITKNAADRIENSIYRHSKTFQNKLIEYLKSEAGHDLLIESALD